MPELRPKGWTCTGEDLVVLMTGPKGLPVVAPQSRIEDVLAEQWSEAYDQPLRPFAGGDHYHWVAPAAQRPGNPGATTDEVDRLTGVITGPMVGRSIAVVLARKVLDAGYRWVDPDEGHLIDFREDGWTLSHPLSCRAGGQAVLFECAVNRLAGATFVQAPAVLGRFPISVDATGKILELGDRVGS